MHLKSHETPRKRGRNDKSRKSPVAIRQAKARLQALKRKLGEYKRSLGRKSAPLLIFYYHYDILDWFHPHVF